MHQYTEKQLQDKLASLPEDMQRAITDDSVLENIEALGQKYSLRVDKVGMLVNQVGLVMLGFQKTSDFISHLSEQLEIDRETAESLAIDVDNEVFRKIRESLRTVQFSDDKPAATPLADPEHGDSPARDSLLQEVERHGNDGTVSPQDFTSGSDYSVDSFGSTSATTDVTPAPTPYEQAQTSQEDKLDPTKTFKDHLEKKMESVKPKINADPYKESID